jgi:hypothetical protein
LKRKIISLCVFNTLDAYFDAQCLCFAHLFCV